MIWVVDKPKPSRCYLPPSFSPRNATPRKCTQSMNEESVPTNTHTVDSFLFPTFELEARPHVVSGLRRAGPKVIHHRLRTLRRDALVVVPAAPAPWRRTSANVQQWYSSTRGHRSGQPKIERTARRMYERHRAFLWAVVGSAGETRPGGCLSLIHI